MLSRYLPYTLSLRAPAVLTSLGGDPNSSRTLPFIPGSALRGAAAHALGDPGGDADRQQQFRRMILDGSVRFLNAYPRAAERRTLPSPVSLRIDKTVAGVNADEIKVWDLAAFSGQPDKDEAAWPELTLAALPDPFVSIGAAQPLRVQPGRGSRIHQQRDRSRGRAWKGVPNGIETPHGAIFAFEFLEAGQEFDGLIQIRVASAAVCEEIAEAIRAALAGPVLLGRSRRGGYGGNATIVWGNPREREVEGQGLVRRDLGANILFCALLTSPYVGRNPDSGQIDPTHLARELVEALGDRVAIVRRRWTFELVGGFNRKWRLELPQALTCAAGSVLVLRTTAPIPCVDLLALEHAGLGERRVEGFGRVVFIDAPAERTILRQAPVRAVPSPVGDPPDAVRFAERRILVAAVERVIAEEAARLARSAESPPAASLLGRLRNALRASPEVALATFQMWLAQKGPARLRPPATEQLERCRVGDDRRRLSDWLWMIAGEQDWQKLATLLRLDAIAQRSHVVSEQSALATLRQDALWIRARLIDSMLAALARRQRSGRSR